ncbi:THUMP domain-containing class I SAM-dependent RNA methyltransferase [Luteibaculum oceani]|uniref:Class I SAM-dependent RNA methyltransferase n=1 Tax=Luteibaculum oceani TaxID=1294296 RepID=A0A5C6V8K9_9FLAO|nr:THUMP domain-containing protein [Luteibaculum oceani]TXC81357.1 class I SAM-dependent RNA methyltransferase [Luteibaculum oceani]
MAHKSHWIAKTFFGLEDVVAEELEEFGATDIEPIKRAVAFSAEPKTLYKILMGIRSAHFVLKELYQFQASNPEELYQGIMSRNWDKHLDVDGTFKVESVCSGDLFTHSKFVALKTKDAIADYFRDRFDKRPSVDFDNPQLIVHVHINQDKVRVLLNTCNEPLFKRSYRQETGKAPINECLAAGILLKAGWKKYDTLWDPMCGAGTFGIEAAMIKRNIAPNLDRRFFGIEHWPDFVKDDFVAAKRELRNQIDGAVNFKINASDIDRRVLDAARRNAENAGVEHDIKYYRSDIRNPLITDDENGLVVVNPPYDHRLNPQNILDLYQAMGDSFKKNFTGKKVYVISSNREAMKNIALRPSKKHTVFNGGLECMLYKYEIFSGDLKSHKSKQNRDKS